MLDVGFGMGHAARECSPTDHRSIFSHAENLSMRARFSGHIPKGQKFIAQRQAKRHPGYNVPYSLRPAARAKVLKHSVLCLLLSLQGVV